MSHGSKATAGERKGLPPSLDDDRITPEILNKLAALDLESEMESEEEHEYQKPSCKRKEYQKPSCRRKDRSRESTKERKHHQTPKYQHSPSAYASEEPFSQRMPHAPSPPPIFRSRFEYSSPYSYSCYTTAREEELRMRMEERLRERMAPRGTDERLQMEMEDRLRERMRPKQVTTHQTSTQANQARISAGETALTSRETICHATETLHGFCGHITTDFKNHSPIYGLNQSLSRSGPRSGGSGSSTLNRAGSVISPISKKIRSRPGMPRSERSNNGALARLGRALSTKASSIFKSNSLSSMVGSITGRRGIPDNPANTFSFSTRIPCPQLLIQPLHSPFSCPHCADIWVVRPRGVGKEGTEREMMAEEGIDLEQRIIRLKPMMQEWAARMNARDCRERVEKKGGKAMEEDPER